MAVSLFQRLTNSVPQANKNDPNSSTISPHDFGALMLAYKLDTTLGLTPTQWRDAIAVRLDLDAAQTTDLVEWTTSVDTGAVDLTLYEHVLMLAWSSRHDDNTQRMLTGAQVKAMLGVTSG